MSLELLKEQLNKAEVIKEGNYKFSLNNIVGREPALDPAILNDCADKLLKKLNYQKATKILTAEAMGIPITTAISLKTSLPFIIATKKKEGSFDEISVDYICGYENSVLHIENIKKGERILIIDDLISTGKTIISLIEKVKKIGATVEDIGTVFSKVDYGGIKELKRMGYQPKTLLEVRLKEDKIEVKEI